MNALRAAREVLGWSLERVAANACIEVYEIEALERVPVHPSEGATKLLIQIFKDRGVRFNSQDGAIVSIVDGEDDLFAGFSFSMPDVELLGMLSAAYRPIEVARDMPSLRTLRMHRMIQVAVIYEVMDFEGDEVREVTGRFKVRLSKRGLAYMAYLRNRGYYSAPPSREMAD